MNDFLRCIQCRKQTLVFDDVSTGTTVKLGPELGSNATCASSVNLSRKILDRLQMRFWSGRPHVTQ